LAIPGADGLLDCFTSMASDTHTDHGYCWVAWGSATLTGLSRVSLRLATGRFCPHVLVVFLEGSERTQNGPVHGMVVLGGEPNWLDPGLLEFLQYARIVGHPRDCPPPGARWA
jgi:hypothetical protein